ncbi:MAG: pentapeptide repeat-containing protein [Rothia sp. (in: high G+C Gram-positive bacteria)]|nr:pentapeptide repeat-containing protein [Rothia sp. (in: high G+C Gram-positive bacteria)]
MSASYFQLASLYKDWETLSKTSDLIALQKESQQRNILKLLFGVYQESDEKGSSDKKVISDEKNSSDRSEIDIRTLNSVIQDIFPHFEEGADNESSSAQTEEAESKTPDGQQGTFDLSYLDLRGLDLSRRDLRGANLIGARLARAFLWRAHLAGSNLRGARLEKADLRDTHLEGANLMDARMEGVNLWGAHLAGANLVFAHLAGANLGFARLDNASFFFGSIENPQDSKVRSRIIDQLKASEMLPVEDDLVKAMGFDWELVIEIIEAHKEEQAGKEAQAGKQE